MPSLPSVREARPLTCDFNPEGENLSCSAEEGNWCSFLMALLLTIIFFKRKTRAPVAPIRSTMPDKRAMVALPEARLLLAPTDKPTGSSLCFSLFFPVEQTSHQASTNRRKLWQKRNYCSTLSGNQQKIYVAFCPLAFFLPLGVLYLCF